MRSATILSPLPDLIPSSYLVGKAGVGSLLLDGFGLIHHVRSNTARGMGDVAAEFHMIALCAGIEPTLATSTPSHSRGNRFVAPLYKNQ